MGSLSFLALVGELLALSHVATVGLAAAAAKMLPDLAGDQYYSSCAIGFSAVLFALKVVLSYRTPGWSHVAGFELPTKVCHPIMLSPYKPNASLRLLERMKEPS